MGEQKLSEYIEYIKNLNLLSKLDLILMDENGTVFADFIKCSKHKFIQKRRNKARKTFVEQVLKRTGDKKIDPGIQELVLVDNYYFYAMDVWIEKKMYVLCMGPFYIEEHIAGMLEPDLPYYKTLELKTAVQLFQMLPSEKMQQEDFGEEKTDASLGTRVELDIREMQSLNPTSQIRYNARNEKIIRSAITNGDIEMIKKYNSDFEYLSSEHFMAGEEPMKRARRGISGGNSIYCRAAEDGGASSVMVRSICADYAEKIEHAGSVEELARLRKEAALIYCQKVRETKQKHYSIHVKHCVNWIEEHLVGEITLMEAAKACGISYDYLSRLIRKDCGCSFSELVHRSRCKRATYYLQEENEIWRVAEKCGYKSSSQFCHAFQHIYGKSPKKWIQEQNL